MAPRSGGKGGTRRYRRYSTGGKGGTGDTGGGGTGGCKVVFAEPRHKRQKNSKRILSCSWQKQGHTEMIKLH